MNTIVTTDARRCGSIVFWAAPWSVRSDTGNGCPPAGIRVEGTVAQRVIAAVLLALPMVTREAFFSDGRSTRMVRAREAVAWILRYGAGMSYGAIARLLHRDTRMVVEAVRRADARQERETDFSQLLLTAKERAGL